MATTNTENLVSLVDKISTSSLQETKWKQETTETN